MSHELHLHKIGPINDCRLTLDSFTILTGPQANGKSTAAKSGLFLSVSQTGYPQHYDAGGAKRSYRGQGFHVEHRSEAADERQVFAAFRDLVGHAV